MNTFEPDYRNILKYYIIRNLIICLYMSIISMPLLFLNV